MKKKICFLMILCLCVITGICSTTAVGAATMTSVMVPATGDVTSIVALALAGVAAIGGLLLRKAK